MSHWKIGAMLSVSGLLYVVAILFLPWYVAGALVALDRTAMFAIGWESSNANAREGWPQGQAKWDRKNKRDFALFLPAGGALLVAALIVWVLS